MKILGIDPGTARMGYSVIEVDSTLVPKMLETDTIITPAEEEAHKRLRLLYKKLTEIIAKHQPKIMVIEKLFFNTNVKTAINVGQARGVALLSAANKKMFIYEYTALQAKLVLTGYGRSDKKQMQAAVKDKLGLPEIIKSDDANDALAMALCFVQKDFEVFLNGSN